jgi:hypothetical protein
MTADQMAARIAELENELAEEKQNVVYYRDLVETLRLRALALSEEVELLK